MAEVFVRHTLNPRKVAKFNLNLRKYTLKGEEGETKWVLEIGTTTPDKEGNVISPEFINTVSETDLEKEIEAAISRMCLSIDWSSFDVDKYPPIVTSFSPKGSNVPIKSKVVFTIVDDSPASGIDLSNLSVIFNNGDVDFDITSEVSVSGDPYEYTVSWKSPNINR